MTATTAATPNITSTSGQSADLTTRLEHSRDKLEKMGRTITALDAQRLQAHAHADTDTNEHELRAIQQSATQLVPVLDNLQQIHPFLSVAVTTFKGLLNLQMKRRDMDKRVSALVLQASDMMSELMPLRNLLDSDVMTSMGDTVRARLENILRKVVDVIRECGSTIDVYMKASLVVRFMRSQQWDEKFKSFSASFDQLSRDMHEVLLLALLDTQVNIAKHNVGVRGPLESAASHAASRVISVGSDTASVDSEETVTERIVHRDSRGDNDNDDDNELGRPREISYTPSKTESLLDTTGEIAKDVWDRMQEAQDYFNEHAEVIDAAFSALNDMIANEALQRAAKDVLQVLDKVTGALDCIEHIHPFVGVAVLAFKGIIALEQKRRGNDVKLQGLLLQNADMMTEFLQLRDLRDPTLFTYTGRPVPGRIQTVLKKMVAATEACGNAIHTYSDSHFISKLFKSIQWESTFTTLATDFIHLKAEMSDALIRHTALRVEDVSSQIAHLQTKFDGFLNVFRTKNSQEEAFSKEVERRGGIAACLQRTADVRDILQSVGVQTAGATINEAMLQELRVPVRTQLEENRKQFQIALNEQTAELKASIRNAQDKILKEFQSAAVDLVLDPHIRTVWKTNRWSLLVRTKEFIAGLCDYFEEHIETLKASETNSGGNDSFVDVDGWCLQYIHVHASASLEENFDSDTNGLVNVREVNAYCSSPHVPASWTLLQRLAYSAAGWHIEQIQYRNQIQALLNTMASLSQEVIPANRGLICSYLDSSTLTWVKRFMMGLAELKESPREDVNSLVHEHMAWYESQMKTKLDAARYKITRDNLHSLVNNASRNDKRSTPMEQHLLPLTYIILRRHVSIMFLGKTLLLDVRDLDSHSLDNITAAAQLRMEDLSKSFIHDDVEPDVRFRSYSLGLFYDAWRNTAPDNAFRLWRAHDKGVDSMPVEIISLKKSDLQFDPLHLMRPKINPTQVHPYGRKVHNISKGCRRFHDAVLKVCVAVWMITRARMRRYAAIGQAAALDELCWQRNLSCHMSTAQRNELSYLTEVLPPQCMARCRAAAGIRLRETTVVHRQSACEGCKQCPIVGTRYDCIECSDRAFHLCEDCANNPSLAISGRTHTFSHRLLILRTETPRDEALRWAANASANLDSYLAQARSKLGTATGTEALLQCSECNDNLDDILFCCVTCAASANQIYVFCIKCNNRKSFIRAAPHASHGHILARLHLTNPPDSISSARSPDSLLPSHDTLESLHQRIDALDQKLEVVVNLLYTMMNR